MKPFEDFQFNKKFGQNFISDLNLLNAIVQDSGIFSTSNVLEIGTGAGTLTDAISKKAKKLVSFEIDKKLTEYLTEKFKNYNNVKIVFADALKTNIKEIEKLFNGENFSIIANLPYYITTPLIFKFLKETNKVDSITIMVQKEVALRAVATKNTKDYGVLSVALQSVCDCKIARYVNRKMFTPVPNVDSAVLCLKRKPNTFLSKGYSDFITGIFLMKRKTLYNNLINLKYDKSYILNAFKELNLNVDIRSQALSPSEIQQLYTKLGN